MKKLQFILEKYSNIFSNNIYGSETAIEANKHDFIATIQVVSRQNRMFLWINVIMLLVVFVGSILLIIYYIKDLNKVALISGVSGLSLAGMISYMTNLWRQIVGIELAIAMADRMDNNSMPAIINSLLSTIKKEKE